MIGANFFIIRIHYGNKFRVRKRLIDGLRASRTQESIGLRIISCNFGTEVLIYHQPAGSDQQAIVLFFSQMPHL